MHQITLILGVHINSEGLNRLEKEVTKTFLVGVIPQLLSLPLPWLMFAVSYHFLCHCLAVKDVPILLG
jgi:hypothetical protein